MPNWMQLPEIGKFFYGDSFVKPFDDRIHQWKFTDHLMVPA